MAADDKRLVPAFELLVDGQKADPELAGSVIGIRCSDDMDRAARFQLHISDVGRKWTKSDKFKPGTAIEIKPWQRRWPLVAGLILLPRLLRKKAIR